MKRRALKQKQQQQLVQLGCPNADAIAEAKTLGEVPEEVWKSTILWLCAKIDPKQCRSQEDLPAFLASFGVPAPTSNFVGRASGTDLNASFELLVQGARAASSKKGLGKRFAESCSFMGHVIQNRERLFPATLKRRRSDGTAGDAIPLQTFNPSKRHKSLIKLNSELENKIERLEKENAGKGHNRDVEDIQFEEIHDVFSDKQDGDVEVTFDIEDYKSIIDNIDCVCTIYNMFKENK